MTEKSKPRSLLSVLVAVQKKTYAALNGKYTNPRTTAMLRLAAICLMLPICGPVGWQAIGSMPSSLVIFILLAIGIRLGLWWWRRQP